MPRSPLCHRCLVLIALFLALLGAGGFASARPVDSLARAYAGLPDPRQPTLNSVPEAGAAYRQAVDKSWTAYRSRTGQPAATWAAKHITPAAGGTVFYPFAGPDLVTVAQLFPEADRYVLVAMQPAQPPLDPLQLSEAARRNFYRKFSSEWQKFGRLGFFRTNDLDADVRDKQARIGLTTTLMAFAVRLGYEVIEVSPISLNPETGEFEPLVNARTEVWNSVRLTLSRAGKTVRVDYVRMDLSNSYLESHESSRVWMARMTRHPVFLKAASHLPQNSGFSIIRDAIVMNAPLLVQDETGIDYRELGKIGDVALYGHFERPHPLFNPKSQQSLAAAYRVSKISGELPFSFSYQKASSQRCLQVVRRRVAATTAQAY